MSCLTRDESGIIAGFHITGAFDKILDIDKCWLMDDVCNKIRNYIKKYAVDNNFGTLVYAAFCCGIGSSDDASL